MIHQGMRVGKNVPRFPKNQASGSAAPFDSRRGNGGRPPRRAYLWSALLASSLLLLGPGLQWEEPYILCRAQSKMKMRHLCSEVTENFKRATAESEAKPGASTTAQVTRT